MLLIFWILLAPALAQRPSNASLCDYYAIQRYGANTTTTQFNLVQSILALAFAGGSGLPNVSSALTGIFNPGTFTQSNSTTINVDLGPWFNGSIDSTNVNGQAAAVDWLNGGGKAPLTAFLTGQTSNIVITNTTNEYRLFNHWLSAFSHIFACTIPAPVPPQTGGFLNLAYVHKFMDLNHTDIGHFIGQISLATQYFGFAPQDAEELSSQMNAKYNVRCSPAVGTQLYSLCQDETCPLAENPDCNAYLNLGPSGVISSGTVTSTSQFIPTVVPATSAPSPATTTTSSSQSPAATSSSSSSSSAIGTGGIAGIAIGGAALTFAFVLALVYLLRRKNGNVPTLYEPSPLNPSYANSPRTDPHSSYHSNQIVQSWTGPPIAEMESVGSPDRGSSVTPQMRLG